jgi:hypothetical protein
MQNKKIKFTKTNLEKLPHPAHDQKDGKYLPKMLGVIEGPVNKMIKAYPNEFSFMRHETKRSLRPSARGKNT